MAKKTYVEVLNQIEVLRKEADRLKREESDGVIRRIRDAVEAYGLTPDDIFGGRGRGKTAGAKKTSAKTVKPAKAGKAAKSASSSPYSDGKGNVWGGRGPRPLWLREALAGGATLQSFATAKAPATNAAAPKVAAGKKNGRAAAGKRAATKRVGKAKRASVKQQASALSEAASQDTSANA